MRIERRRLLLLVPAALLAAALLAVVLVLWRAQHTLEHAAGEVREAEFLPYTLRPLDTESLRAANPGFEPVGSPGGWMAGAELGGDMYLAGPAGLVQLRAGRPVHLWRTGLDLPASPITAVSTGHLRTSAEPQLLLATAGAGALVLTPGPHPAFQQLLPTSPAGQDLTALAATSTGELLLGTRNAGLLVFSGQTLAPASIHLPGVDAARLAVTSIGVAGPSILIGTRDAGALYLHAGTAVQIAPSELPDGEIESMALSADRAFLGTPVGVAELDLATGRVTRTLAPGLFAHALALSAGALSVGTLDQGLRTVPLTPQPRLRRAAFQPANPVSALRIDQLIPTGDGLLALSGGNLLRLDGSENTPELPPATLTDSNVSALALAPDGRLWVGLFDRGLDVLDPVSLTRVRHLEDDRLFCIDRLAVDPARHTVAAATANGLVLFDASGDPRQTLTRRDGLIADHINDLAFTPSGLALATPAGITFLNPSGPESLYAFQGLVNNHVYTLAQSPDGRQLLAGTLGGLSLLESASVRQNLTVTNSPLRHNWITAAIPQGPSTWLIGTYGAGLETLTLTPGGRPALQPAELPAGTPRDLVINPNALLATPTAIYAGTLGYGLLVYHPGSRRWSVVTRGLPSLNVTAFAAAAGTLYVGTENGLVRIAEARLAGGAQ